MEYEKMKVSELRQLLKERGLAGTGNKSVLIARLESSAENGAEEENLQEQSDLDEDVVVGSVTEEDDILNEDVEDVEGDDDPAEELEEAEETKVEEVPQPAEELPKKIILTKISFQEKDDTKTPEKPTTDEAKTKRAERFGIQSEESKKQARAARFGLPVQAAKGTTATSTGKLSSPKAQLSADEVEKLKKRAERFGTIVSTELTKVDNQDRLQKRKARFGVATSTGTVASSAEIEEKKKRRLERFGMSK